MVSIAWISVGINFHGGFRPYLAMDLPLRSARPRQPKWPKQRSEPSFYLIQYNKKNNLDKIGDKGLQKGPQTCPSRSKMLLGWSLPAVGCACVARSKARSPKTGTALSHFLDFYCPYQELQTDSMMKAVLMWMTSILCELVSA